MMIIWDYPKVGYVFYVGEYQWKYDWGGLLQMRVDDDVKTILPNKNID